MSKKKYYAFTKKSIRVIPLQYHFFEKMSSKDSKIIVKLNASKKLMTNKVFVISFYKAISRMFE